MINFTAIKKGQLILAIFLIVTGSVSAQKSVYDVVPGSGPKKKETTTVEPRKREADDRNDKVYYGKRKYKRLPPGQAKKIYGGSATDYAPGKVKKRKGWYWNDENKKWYRKHKKGHKRYHKHR